LDIKSKNVLKEALINFEGTLLLVSHDRDFLQGLTTKVYEFKDHQIKEYLGDIDYFLEQRNLENLREAEKKTKSESKTVEKNESKTNDYEIQKQLKSLKNRLSNVERTISKLESEIEKADIKLLNNYDEAVAQPDFFKKYEQKKQQLNREMESWEKLVNQIDALE